MTLALAALLALTPSLAEEETLDRIETTEGREYEGRVVFENEEKLVLRTGSREKEFQLSELAEVRSIGRSLGELLGRQQEIEPGDLAATKELARFARSRGLHGEARALWLQALLYDPQDEEANEALGNRKRREYYELRHGNRWWTLEDLKIRTRDWGEAWELSSAHYELRTNLGLQEGISMLFDTERFYRSFFEFMREGVELYETTKMMSIQVHADEASFPNVVGTKTSYTDGQNRTAFVDASAGLDRGVLTHESWHLLVHMTTVEARSSRGVIPDWLDEGLAEYFRAALHGPFGRATYTPGDKNYYHFKEHATTGDPYELGRLLQFGRGDYLVSSGTRLRYAQSYTLVDYLLHGEGGELRERFFEFLALCYEGRSSVTYFKNTIGVDEDELDEGWDAYAERLSRGG